jgi:alpha-ribazole phosphatase
MNAGPQLITSVWLIRHGETTHHARGRCYGSLDVVLSPTRVGQMQAVARCIPSGELAAIYCSPRTRCRHSAEIIASQQTCPVTVVEELAELNFGDFEGRTYNEIAAAHPELYAEWMANPTKVHFPGGESFAEMWKRVSTAVAKLRATHAALTFGIVAHEGVNRIVLAEALGLSAENIFRIAQRCAALNLVQYYGEQPVVELMNISAVAT